MSNFFHVKDLVRHYCGIIRINGGSIFVEFVGTPHLQIYILNKIISKIFIEIKCLLNTLIKKRNGIQYSLLYE